MVLGGQGMEPEEILAKVQVVYYLSRGGQLQQPHLIDVDVPARSNELYLRDVKKKLTAIRGKGVADSFSWSCKRNYKDNYVWQDLSDNDRILPLSDGEIVLKGSGLFAGYRTEDKIDNLDGQIEPESTSLSPQHPVKLHKIEMKKFDFEAVKRNLDLQADHLQDRSNLAAALTLSLQLMNNPHNRRFSKDKSMDLNQQVMNSLSQAKAGPAEERILDHSYDMSSSETFHSEESTAQNNFPKKMSERAIGKCTTSSSRTEQNYDPAAAKQAESNDGSSYRDGPKIRKDAAKGRQENPEGLPSIKTKKCPTCSEHSDPTGFTLSPRRIMEAVLSTPGKMLHSSSTRSSTLSATSSMPNEGSLSAIKLSKQATCLSQFRICGQLNHHATDSRPESPVRQNQHSTIAVQPSAIPVSPTSRGQGGPYWTRWKAGRKPRPTSENKEVSEPITPIEADSQPGQEERSPTHIRRVLKTSFEFDMPAKLSAEAPGTPSLQTESSNLPVTPRKTRRSPSSVPSNVDASGGNKVPSTASSGVEAMSPISVKEVITEHLPILSKADGGPNPGGDSAGKDNLSPDLSGQTFSIDTANLPRVSISDAISAARETVRTAIARPESPESPLKPDPPSSPIRTSGSSTSLKRVTPSPSSFNKRSEDGRARARGLVKEVSSKDSRFMKDLAKELERSKVSTGTMRSIASSKRAPGMRNSIPSPVGVKSISSTFNKSPPRISSLLWEDSGPLTPKKINLADRDERPLTAGRSNLDWEKTLQETASVSLPPPDFGQILKECGQCGRTFKPDSLKVHIRGCNGLRRGRELHTFNGSTLTMRTQQ